ncbi:SMP-30/gluconolactonase/LRE family protein [Mucilaginibacter sp. JRF]|uniref:SMP-30/gluconolactonase/LRE family protein n=1 Tax=Mucilaginibacter sp. JRF TaxID=2780088 RepID=UPI00187E3E51|nr:SMP-30/gluconolactonase/LRE family protein [Mucilaginibacter sp. JRF]MBE9586661.1 SMP-30/gluconolactonase/LRE family protein [Mucilaginibacter sp. JRF]
MKIYQYITIGALLIAGCKVIEPSPTSRINFSAEDSYPEGIAYDSTRNIYYVSSARLGTVGKVTPAGIYSPLYSDNTLKSTYGMKIHADGKRLYVCEGDANYSKFTTPATRDREARLLIIDLATGKKLADIDLSGLMQGKHFPNDLTFDAAGNAYITDSFAHTVYKVDAAGKASVFGANEKLITEGIGINGIAFHSGGFLLLDNSATGMIYKMSLANPNDVQAVKTDQFFMGADGMLLNAQNKLTVVVNGGNDKIFQLESTDNWQTAKLAATTLIADRFTYPATATFNRYNVWVMNSRFNELVDSNAVPSKQFAIQHAVFKPIPKPKS